jgi:hypothetical protein
MDPDRLFTTVPERDRLVAETERVFDTHHYSVCETHASTLHTTHVDIAFNDQNPPYLGKDVIDALDAAGIALRSLVVRDDKLRVWIEWHDDPI